MASDSLTQRLRGTIMSPPLTVTSSTATDEEAPLLGADAQLLIECNQKLKDLGIHHTIKLPRICVIGDQSTGKSSLIEAISTIAVPKAQGCCTQCPIAINLSSGSGSSASWSCTVYIEQNYEFKKSKSKSAVTQITKANPFGPWQPLQQPNLIKLETTGDKRRVGHLIRIAQAVVLNPGVSATAYLSGAQDIDQAVQLSKFSPNVIRLDVSEANWPNLSFIDLPGVIANAKKPEDRYLVQLIKNLVTGYVQDESSYNLLALPMTHDVENSQACGIIQSEKVEDRTLAVFTKSDLADKDQLTETLSQFCGAKDGLGFKHGYHIVMMPDGVNMEQSLARQQEASFFRNPPWSSLDDQQRARLGVGSLSVYLRRLLFEKTAEALPQNLAAIEARLSTLDTRLESLPAPPEQERLPYELIDELVQFKMYMKELFQGTEARQTWNAAAMKFRNRITESAPTMRLSTQSEARALKLALNAIRKGATIEVASDDEQEQATLPVKKERPAGKVSQDTRFDAIYSFRLEEIREINEKNYSSFYFGEIELKALDELNKKSVMNWHILLEEYMEECTSLLQNQISKAVEEVFGHRQHLALYAHINGWCDRYMKDMLREEVNTGREICKREQEQPFTLQCDTLKKKEETCFTERTKKRVAYRLKLLKAELDAAEGVVKSKREECKEAKLGLDGYSQEVLMSAKTRAYYEIAADRFTDVICQSVFINLLPKCGETLVKELQEHLGAKNPKKHPQIISLMSEDKEREELRQRLVHERSQLIEGHGYISKVLGNGISSLALESPGKRKSSPSYDDTTGQPESSKRSRTSSTVVNFDFQDMEGVELND